MAGCAHATGELPRSAGSGSVPSGIVADTGFVRPLVDHHKHLPSVAAARLVSTAPQPAVELPPELARLLGERTRAWNDSTALGRLYTDESTLLVPNDGTADWVRGRSAVAAQVARTYDRSYRITPIRYAVQGNGGFIAGYLTRGDGDSTLHFGSIHLSLERGGDGAWRIAAETPAFEAQRSIVPLTAEHLIAEMDAAGVRRAVVLSVAYWFGSPRFQLSDEVARVRAENDYTARQVARYPDRLVGFCSISPLKDYAVAEIERCASELRLRGLKLHFGSSRVDVTNPEHVAKVRAVFAAANRLRLPITVHSRAVTSLPYGSENARIFLEQILPAAPDVPVTVAHLWGGASFSQPALETFAAAVAARAPQTKNLYFDVTEAAPIVVDSDTAMAAVARAIRQIGVERILWGSDMAPPGTPMRRAWLDFRALPLTDREFRIIASNVAPYLR